MAISSEGLAGTSWVRAYRLVAAAATLFAIAFQLDKSRDKGFSVANFFSFFTIESNIFAAVVLLIGALAGTRYGPTLRWDLIRGAATLYMATTGVVYGLLLAGYQEALQTTTPWVDTVVHRFMPLVLVIDWLIVPPANKLTMRQALVWLIYPIAYCVYSLIRGPIVDWYPYPFLDPDESGGYAGVAAYCVGIAAGVVLFSWTIVLVSRHVRLTRA